MQKECRGLLRNEKHLYKFHESVVCTLPGTNRKHLNKVILLRILQKYPKLMFLYVFLLNPNIIKLP